jgi:hypothetical protein
LAEENIDPDTGMPENPMFPKPKPQMQKFRMNVMKAQDGSKILMLQFATGRTSPDGAEEYMYFAVHGEELVKFYDYVKRVVEGERRPSYLG